MPNEIDAPPPFPLGPSKIFFCFVVIPCGRGARFRLLPTPLRVRFVPRRFQSSVRPDFPFLWSFFLPFLFLSYLLTRLDDPFPFEYIAPPSPLHTYWLKTRF